MPRLGTLVVTLVLILFTLTCARITVNVYFPAAAIQDAATEIEREVRGTETPPGSPSPTKPPDATTPPRPPQGSSLWSRVRYARLHLTPASAQAQNIDINISTPEIRQLIASRKQRYPRLIPFFNREVLGENNQGLLTLRSPQGLSLQETAQVKTLLRQENADRQRLYRALAIANKLPLEKTTDIARIFAQVHRREAPTNWWVQDENGTWKKNNK